MEVILTYPMGFVLPIFCCKLTVLIMGTTLKIRMECLQDWCSYCQYIVSVTPKSQCV
jgi:hypothetical protein